MREQEAIALTQELLNDGADPLSILDACRDARPIVGKRFEEGESFLPKVSSPGKC